MFLCFLISKIDLKCKNKKRRKKSVEGINAANANTKPEFKKEMKV